MKKILIGTIALFAFFYLALIILNKNPPAWDEAWYLSTSINLYRNLVLGNLFVFLKSFSQAFGGDKAPLISVLPLPFYLIFGTSFLSAMLVNITFVALTSLFIFKLVKYLEGSDAAGLFSILVFNTMPLFHDFARQFMVEYGLSFLVLASVYYLLRSNYFQNEKSNNLLAILLGLGLLMKVIYPFYLIGPLFVIFLSMFQFHKNLINKDLAKRIGSVIFFGILIASVWYAYNFRTVLRYGFSSGYGQISAWYGRGSIFNLSAIGWYIKDFIQNGISLYYFVLLLFYFLIFSLKQRSLRMRFNHDSLLAVWFLLPFLILLFAPNKILRFLLPAFVPIAIFIGVWTDRIFRKKGMVFLLLPFCAFVLGPFIHSPLSKTIFNPPSINMDSDWKIEEVIAALPKKGNISNIVLCAVDHHFYNNFTLNYYSTLKFYPHRFIRPPYRSNPYKTSKDQHLIEYLIANADFILVKTGYLGPDFTNPFSSAIRDFVLEHKSSFKEIRSFSLPDDSFISIYEKVS